MKHIFTIILALVIVNLMQASNDPVVSLSKVTPEGGVAYTAVICIGEDSNGFIWFGTNNGLFRYNSVEIKKYSYSQTNPTGLLTNRINKIYNDNSGQLLIVTEKGLCLYNPSADDFTPLIIKDQLGELIGDNIEWLIQDVDSTYWMVDEKGVAIVDIKKRRANYINIDNNNSRARLIQSSDDGTLWVHFQDGKIYFKQPQSNDFILFATGISDIPRAFFANKQYVWIGYDQNGLLCFDRQGKQIRHFSEESGFLDNRVRSIEQGAGGNLWVATYNGIAILNGLEIIKVVDIENYPELPNHSIWSLFKDSNRNMWIGTWLGGLCFNSEFKNTFSHHSLSNNKNSINDNVISSFIQSPIDSSILIGTDNGSLNRYDPTTKLFYPKPVIYKGLVVNNIKSLAYDKFNTLWIGSHGQGVLYKKRGESQYSKLKTDFSAGVQALNICAVDDGVWINDYSQGVYFYDFDTREIKRYLNRTSDSTSISDNYVRHILQDKNGNMWFATQNGLNLLKKDTDRFVRFFHDSSSPNSLSANFIYSMLEDAEGNLWLGTNGSGLDKFNPYNYQHEHYTRANGLPGNDVYSIIAQDDKNLWLATDKGLCSLNTQTDSIRSFSFFAGINNNQFNPNAALQAVNGELYFGGSNGFVAFDPNKISLNPIKPKSIVTQLFVHNKEVLPKQDNNILSVPISMAKSLKLKYQENTFAFKFVSNNFINPAKNKFKYRMLDYYDEWIESDDQAVFTNVPPGHYTFEIIAANNDGVWNDVPTKIAIHIIPPLWQRWYAFVAYLLMLLLGFAYFRSQVINKQKLINEIDMSRIRSETEERSHQMKLQLFTNISHEFRTPLTLILGPVDRLLNSGKQDETDTKQLSLIKNNADRLLRLMNQFLDFRKMESGKMKLNPVSADIVLFCKNIFNCFDAHATHRSFTIAFISDEAKLKIDFDPDKLDKVLFNIIANAFKYSQDGSSVTMEIKNNQKTQTDGEGNIYYIGDEVAEDFVEISITDTGRGMNAEHLPKIFDRFYQINTETLQGTGIGLALSKSYVLLHNGQLKVNTQEHRGTIFTIYIPKSQPNALKETIDSENLNVSYGNYTAEPVVGSLSINPDDEDIQSEDALVLIVEDNVELLDYLSDLLKESFRVVKAHNGKVALEKVHSLFPNLIISDVMMPEMDGIELCSDVKNDIRTSHIPVILLTALDTVRDRITGLHSGADAYIPKPFDDKLLIAQCENLLHSRRALRLSFGQSNVIWEENFGNLGLDKKLIQKAIATVEANLNNYDFTVEMMASGLNLSRTHLHRKLKSLTNHSATEFIRDIRLKKAVELMKVGDHKVNEIGYEVGFNSHNYFTRSFKKQYGMSPSDFMKENFGHS